LLRQCSLPPELCFVFPIACRWLFRQVDSFLLVIFFLANPSSPFSVPLNTTIRLVYFRSRFSVVFRWLHCSAGAFKFLLCTVCSRVDFVKFQVFASFTPIGPAAWYCSTLHGPRCVPPRKGSTTAVGIVPSMPQSPCNFFRVGCTLEDFCLSMTKPQFLLGDTISRTR